jgi:co-chaperonin GroES (HSP10)
MNVRPKDDNVFVQLEPLDEVRASGLVLIGKKPGAKEVRTGTVMAVGPGHWTEPNRTCPEGYFKPTEVKEGDRVILEAWAGENFQRGFFIPRHNGRGCNLGELGETRGEFRIVREDEILAVIED